MEKRFKKWKLENVEENEVKWERKEEKMTVGK